MKAFTHTPAWSLSTRPRECRHRPDHPQAVPEVDQAHRLRPEPVRRMALSRHRRTRARQQRASAQPGLRAQRAALPGRQRVAGARELRLRFLARTRAVGAGGIRLPRDHRAELRRHLLQQQFQERPAADRAGRRSEVDALFAQCEATEGYAAHR